MKKLLIILGIVSIVGILAFVFYFFIYRGTIEVSPETTGVKIYIGNEVYNEFPAKIRLLPGSYQITVSKENYLTQTYRDKINPFETISIQPSLREYFSVAYIDQKKVIEPTVSSDGSYIYFYNSAVQKIQRLRAQYRQGELQSETPEDISTVIDIGGLKDKIRVNWSSDKSKVILHNGSGAFLFDLSNRKLHKSEGISAIDFFGAGEQIIYAKGNVIYRANLDFTNEQKQEIGSESTTNGEITALYSSPTGNYLALSKGIKLIILDLNKRQSVLEKSMEQVLVKWKDDDKIAVSMKSGDYYSLQVVWISKNKITKLGIITNNLFEWQGNNLLYVSNNNYKPILTRYNEPYNIKLPLYKPSLTDPPRYLLTDKDKVFFSSGKTKPRLLAINME